MLRYGIQFTAFILISFMPRVLATCYLQANGHKVGHWSFIYFFTHVFHDYIRKIHRTYGYGNTFSIYRDFFVHRVSVLCDIIVSIWYVHVCTWCCLCVHRIKYFIYLNQLSTRFNSCFPFHFRSIIFPFTFLFFFNLPNIAPSLIIGRIQSQFPFLFDILEK